MTSFPISEKNRIRRIPKKGNYSKEAVYKIIDEALICQIGIIQNGKPVVIPTIHARSGNVLFFHGSNASRLIKTSDKKDISVSITLLDGIVVARSLFHSSMNYRSVVLFGKGEIVKNKAERMKAFRAITEHLIPGRWNNSRLPNEKELKQTAILKMNIDEASAKISSKFPEDDEEDYNLDIWAGNIPIKQVFEKPVADPKLKKSTPLPDYIKNYKRK